MEKTLRLFNYLKKHELVADGKFLDLDMAVYVDEVESFKTNYNMLKDAVRLMFQTCEAYRKYPGGPCDDAYFKLWVEHQKARKAVEELVTVRESNEQTVAAADKRCYTLRIDGNSFRCECGCNVFHKPDKNDANLYMCNGCGQRFDCE